MQITAPDDIAHIEGEEEVKKQVTIFFGQIKNILNKGIVIQDNLNVSIVSVTFNAANTDTQVAHTLKRTPTGFIVVGASAANTIYNGSTANTDKVMYLRANGTGTAKVIIF